MTNLKLKTALAVSAAVLAMAGGATASGLTPIASYVDPNGGSTAVLGINNAGAMTGAISYADGSSLGFVRNAAGVYTTFSAGFGTVGRAIDVHNNVSGYATDSTLNVRTDVSFLRASGGAITTLTNPVGGAPLNGIPQGINASGVLVGEYYTTVAGVSHTVAHGYILNGASFTPIVSPLSARVTVAARGITDSGLIVGWDTAGPDGYEGFIDNGGVFQYVTDPNPLAVNGTTFEAVNNHGLAVGEWFDAAGDDHAFTYDIGSGVFTDIVVPGAVNTQAFGVNDWGQVVITTDLAEGPNNFIYDAVPEPATWAVMMLGVFGIGGVLRRRRVAAA